MEQSATSRNIWLRGRANTRGPGSFTQHPEQQWGSNFRQPPRDSEQRTQQQQLGVSNYSYSNDRPLARHMTTPLNRRRDDEEATSTYNSRPGTSTTLNHNQERMNRIRAELDHFARRVHPSSRHSDMDSRGSSAAYAVPFPTVEPSRAHEAASTQRSTRPASAAVQPNQGDISSNATANLERNMRLLQMRNQERNKNGVSSGETSSYGARSVPETPPLSPITSSRQTVTQDYGHQTSHHHQVPVFVDARRAYLAHELDAAAPLTETAAVMRTRREHEARRQQNLERTERLMSETSDVAQLKRQAARQLIEVEDLRAKLNTEIQSKDGLRRRIEAIQVEVNSEKRKHLQDKDEWQQELASVESNNQLQLDRLNGRFKLAMDEFKQTKEQLDKERIKKERLENQVSGEGRPVNATNLPRGV